MRAPRRLVVTIAGHDGDYCGGPAVGTTKAVAFLARGRRGDRGQAGNAIPEPVPGARRADQPGPGRHAGHRHLHRGERA